MCKQPKIAVAACSQRCAGLHLGRDLARNSARVRTTWIWARRWSVIWARIRAGRGPKMLAAKVKHDDRRRRAEDREGRRHALWRVDLRVGLLQLRPAATLLVWGAERDGVSSFLCRTQTQKTG
jgi:hypothetical protein